ncbi:hypothetical protein cce_1227 [Crocosphaera subtropica ATCC 51142]|uniref:Uncharacterized protein n=1 Tax=Crocosphaera subtropica (strain ATCC 51142 / BH68) TaxID=43989 RepID=B1WUX6_CROS5|nr:hypothetical protein [Crocosphaera subtropica]ACB50577.1 hypothetical protein cce_1227 [Crocosphaera subtropica ATCC 51142]
MIELHPEFLTKNGQEFVLLPSEEFKQVQEILEHLKKENSKESKASVLNKIYMMQEDSVNNWQIAINQIGQKNKIEQQEKIETLFDSWNNLDKEQEQKETLNIIQSIEDVSI